MAINMNTPNSRMIRDLLMKNAAKYSDKVKPTEKDDTGEEKFPKTKPDCSVGIRKEKKHKQVLLKNKHLGLKNCKAELKIKPEIKIEYTEYEVKTESFDTSIMEASVKKKHFESDKKLRLNGKTNSTILDILKKNVAKYRDTFTAADLYTNKPKNKKIKLIRIECGNNVIWPFHMIFILISSNVHIIVYISCHIF